MQRGPEGVELLPEQGMCSGEDGFIHFSVVARVGEEASWWAIGDDHAVPASVFVQLMRPAHVDGGPITGKGILQRAGTGVIVSEGVVMQDMKEIAKVSVTFIHFVKRAVT